MDDTLQSEVEATEIIKSEMLCEDLSWSGRGAGEEKWNITRQGKKSKMEIFVQRSCRS